MFEWFINKSVFLLLKASGVTLSVALCSLILGLLLAFIFATLESYCVKWLAKLITLIVMMLRGLPEILVVIAIYNGIPMILGAIADGFTLNLFITKVTIQCNITNFDISPLFCGITALSLLYAAYASQTLRGAFKAIPIGQWQAAQVLGLSKKRTLTHIIIPQIWRHALPGLGNQWLVLLKDTALLSLITVKDIMMQTRNVISQTHEPFTWYLIAAAIYLFISIVSQRILRKLTQKTRYFEQEVNHG